MRSKGLAHAISVTVGLDVDRVPSSVITRAGLVVGDTVGVICAGARSEEMRRLVALDYDEGLLRRGPMAMAEDGSARSEATVLTDPAYHSHPAHAAFLNATAGTFLELDEGMRPTGHPAMHILPAAFAVAESEHATGRDLLRALLVGYEVTSRLFRAYKLRYPVHPHGHFGAIGAAVAAALLGGVDPYTAALIAATTPLLGVWDACYDGATARNTYIGVAARSAVRTISLAKAGFTGSENALDAAFGEIAGQLVDPAVLEADLDYDGLGIAKNYFKVHSACALTHAALDAAIELSQTIDRRHILSASVETISNNMKLDRQPRPNELSGRFSLQYAVATALLLGRTDPEAFRFRPDVAELARKIEVRVAPELEDQWPESSPARVIVESADGIRINTVTNPHGYYSQPLSQSEVRDKFQRLVNLPLPDAESWWKRLTHLTDIADCASLFARQSP